MFDAGIVGSGLAGLHCARLLAQRGLRVVLLDRKASVADAVATTGIFVRRTIEDFPIPEEQLGAPIADVVLYSPARRALRLTAEQPEFRLGRMAWLYLHWLELCVRAGVTWRPSTRLLGIERERTVSWLLTTRNGRTERVPVRFVVGADGARSNVAKFLELDQNDTLLTGIEEVLPGFDAPPAMHCFLDPRLAPGYIAWLVNDGTEAHLGTAGYGRRFVPAEALTELRRELTDRFGLGQPVERRGGMIPVNGILRRIACPQGLLVGDAAGAVSPLTAGGLDAALRLSVFAASVISEYLDSGDASVLRQYSGDRFRARFMARRWMRNALDTMSQSLTLEAACWMLRTAPMKAVARHIFFGRGSFPDVTLVPRVRPAYPR